MKLSLFVLTILSLGLLTGVSFAGENDKVLIVVNDLSTDSLEVGNYYQKLRNIPEDNICHIKCTKEDIVSLKFFKEQIQEPIRKAIKPGIKYIVLTMGIPYRVSVKGEIFGFIFQGADANDSTLKEKRLGNILCVDSFLTMPFDDMIESFERKYTGIKNSYFNKNDHFNPDGKQFLVTRLDAPTRELAKELVDRAIYGEENIAPGYGKGYFDAKGSPKEDVSRSQVDKEIKEASELSKAKGYETVLDEKPAEFGKGACPDSLWYFGWYSWNNYNDAFEWKPGAIGIHLDSASAMFIRKGPSWAGGALLRGITATVGAVDEPMTEPYTKSNLFYKYLFNGFNFAETAYMATPSLKWMMIMIGDPLYSPIASEKKPDTTKPKILHVSFFRDEELPDKRVTVIVEADKLVDSVIEYGADLKYGQVKKGLIYTKKQYIDINRLDRATKYMAKVTVKDALGNIDSKEFTFSTSPKLLNPVKDVKVITGNGEVKLSWTEGADKDFTGYKIFRRKEGNIQNEQIADLAKDTLSYTDKDIENETKYFYRVKVYNDKGIFSWGQEMAVLPTIYPVPTDLKAEKTKTSIKLSWKAPNVEKIGGFAVYKYTQEKSDFIKVQEVYSPEFEDIHIEKGETYHYKAFLIDKYGVEKNGTDDVNIRF